jgi:thiol:disulfide interchange protein DsbC
MLRTLMLSLSLLSPMLPAVAGDTVPDKVRAAIASMAPGASIDGLRTSRMPGMFEASVNGATVYVSADGKYLIAGSLWDVSAHDNLGERHRAGVRKELLASIGQAQRIAFPARDPQRTITVFTDLDCGYCRKLHDHVQAFNDAGVSVEYLLFPRGGLDSPSYSAAVSVWCAADRNDALTRAKRGEHIEGKMCPNPIREEFLIGQRIGIGSTPTVIGPDGTILGGYLTPTQLVAALGLGQPAGR